MHTWARRLLLPWFSHRRVDEYEPVTRELCNRLIDGFIDAGRADAAADYAQQIPARVIALTLGVPGDMADTFTGWVRDVLEFAHDEHAQRAGRDAIAAYLHGEDGGAADEPGDDLISVLLHTEVDGEPIPDIHVLGHRGADPDRRRRHDLVRHRLGDVAPRHPRRADRRRLVAEPELMPDRDRGAAAGLLAGDDGPHRDRGHRARGLPDAGRRPGADELPRRQPRPGGVRPTPTRSSSTARVNRHLAFGVGIHRCAGSNLARMELRVAVETWLHRIPEFRLAEGAEVTWAGGQVRGPRRVPVEF